MTKQIEQPNRTMTTAADAVMEFIKTRLASEDPTFTAEQLRFYVTNSVIGRISPGSADRILRQLRQSGKADYYILNRAKSLYKALPLRDVTGPPGLCDVGVLAANRTPSTTY